MGGNKKGLFILTSILLVMFLIFGLSALIKILSGNVKNTTSLIWLCVAASSYTILYMLNFKKITKNLRE